jgi:hypothetical protein
LARAIFTLCKATNETSQRKQNLSASLVSSLIERGKKATISLLRVLYHMHMTLTMKLSLAAFLLSVAPTAAVVPLRATAGLMKHARRLEDQQNNNQDQQEEEEFAFLANYKLKLLACKSGEKYVNPENGEYESSSVVFRLCPASEECDDEGNKGCKSGYGDFVVGINSFVESYLEDKREDMQQDDAFKVEEFGECREYEADQDAEEDGGNNNNQYQYFVGPACTEEGDGIRLAMFLDEGCSTESTEVTFEDISNGVSLPYSSGGLVSNYCESCSGYNDNGEYELSEMCMRLYENSGKCESEMETYHYMGQQTGSCEFIQSLLPQQKSGAGKAIGWTFFVLVVVGALAAGYFVMKKKRNEKEFGLMES